MSKLCKTLAPAALIGLCTISNASAATYSILAGVGAAFSPGFDPLIPGVDYNATEGPTGNLVVTGVAGIYEIKLYVQSGNYGPAQRGFGFLTFDLALAGMISNSSIIGWVYDNPPVDSNGPPPPDNDVLLWDQNYDLGDDDDDLLDILVAIAVIPSPNPADPRPTATCMATAQVPVPTCIGSLYVDYLGGVGWLNADIVTTAHARDSDGALIDNTAASTRFNALVSFGIPPFLLGDTNGDGAVDIDDLTNVKSYFGDAGPDSAGDADGDGDTDIDDLVAVKNNFGATSPGLSTAPEPASLTLLALGGLIALRRR